MDAKKNGTTVTVSIKDTWQFQKLLELLGKAITDERIAKSIRQEYFEELSLAFAITKE